MPQRGQGIMTGIFSRRRSSPASPCSQERWSATQESRQHPGNSAKILRLTAQTGHNACILPGIFSFLAAKFGGVRLFSHLMITTRIKSPADCTPNELDAFEAMVCAGGEVAEDGLRQRITNAAHLLFLYDPMDELCGISALKRPNNGYRTNIFHRAQASSPTDSYPLELGWVFVSPTHQGQRLSRPLVEQIVPYASGRLVYATTRTDNEPMKRTLTRFGFQLDGSAFRSSRGDYDLVLLVQAAS